VGHCFLLQISVLLIGLKVGLGDHVLLEVVFVDPSLKAAQLVLLLGIFLLLLYSLLEVKVAERQHDVIERVDILPNLFLNLFGALDFEGPRHVGLSLVKYLHLLINAHTCLLKNLLLLQLFLRHCNWLNFGSSLVSFSQMVEGAGGGCEFVLSKQPNAPLRRDRLRMNPILTI